MAESRAHKVTSNRIAKKLGTEYNNGKGVDIKSKRATVEVETAGTVTEAPTQLKGHKGPVYIAGANQETVEKALEVTKGTTIGVMDSSGNIVKSNTQALRTKSKGSYNLSQQATEAGTIAAHSCGLSPAGRV